MSDEAAATSGEGQPDPERDFSAWVQRHFDLVYSAALRQLGGDAHGARDAAQLVFVAAARKRRALARHPAVVGWLYTATHHAVANMIRQQAGRRRREQLAAELLADRGEEADWTAVRPHLDAALLALGQRDRDALLLRFFDQRSHAEIGGQLGLSENAARMRVERALAKLRTRLVRQGIPSSAAALSMLLASNAVAAAPAGLGAAIAAAAAGEAAGAATGAGMALTFHLMATKLTVGLVAAAGLLAGSGVYLALQARSQAEAARSLDRESARWEAALQETTGRAAHEQALLGAARSAPGSAAPSAKPASSLAEAQAFLNQEIAENPQLRQQLGKMLLASFRLEYGPLAKSLGLGPEQFDRVAALNLKLRSDQFDAEQAARLSGLDPARDPGVRVLEQQARDQYAAGLRAAIGDAAATQFLDYDRMADAHQAAAEVAAESAYAGTPLGSADADQLARQLAEASPGYQQGGAFDLKSVDLKRFLEQEGGSLSPAARQALRARGAAAEIDAMEDGAENATGVAP